jgi:type III secretion system (T3SS) negative regulator GrlR
MTAGIYAVKFSAVGSYNFGEGLAVFKDGKVNGGDLGYFYRGSYEISDSRITARLKAKRYNPAIPSIFGSFPEFDLDLAGHIPSDGSLFHIEGNVVQNPQLRIVIDGRRLEDAA